MGAVYEGEENQINRFDAPPTHTHATHTYTRETLIATTTLPRSLAFGLIAQLARLARLARLAAAHNMNPHYARTPRCPRQCCALRFALGYGARPNTNVKRETGTRGSVDAAFGAEGGGGRGRSSRSRSRRAGEAGAGRDGRE